MKIKSIVKYIISLALAGVLLWAAFRGVEWNEFIEGLKGCNWAYVLLSMAAGAFAFWLRGLRWRLLLLPIDDSISRLTTFNGINIANISNFVVPRMGEFVRCGLITRRSAPVDPAAPSRKKASYDKVLGTVVLERSWELIVMLLFLSIVLVGRFDKFGDFFIEKIWLPATGGLDLSLWKVAAGASLWFAALLYLIWPFLTSNSFCQKIIGVFKGLLQGFASCLKMEKKWLFFAYTLAIWLTYWFMAICTMKAVPFLGDLDVIDALFLSLVGGLGFAFPAPGGIGSFHYVIAFTLSELYGIEGGLIYATLSHTSQAITQIVFGLLSYAYEAIKK